MLAIFKNKTFLLLFILTFVLNKCQDKKACDVYNYNLLVIKRRIDIDEHQNLGEVNNSIEFFERLTGIISHSDGNYFGRSAPTKEDYANWLNWYKKNSARLYWDDKDKTVKVR